MKEIVIWGAGGLGRQTLSIIHAIIQDTLSWSFLGWLDDDTEKHGLRVAHYPILGGGEWLEYHSDVACVIAINAPDTRRTIVKQLEKSGFENFVSVVHPSVQIADRATIGKGAIVYPG